MDFFLSLPIPKEIIYDYVIPYSPCFELSRKILRLQRKRMFLVHYIRHLFIDEKNKIIKDVWKNYHNEDFYQYKSEYNYLYIDTSDFCRLNYLYLSS
jgi:hypothetical protein